MELTIRLISVILLVLVVVTGIYHVVKPLPPGVSYKGPLRPATGAEFLADHTWQDDAGRRHLKQAIFDRAFQLIQGAEKLVVLDMFLFNAMQGPVRESHRLLSRELTETLLSRMRARPGLQVVVITDPFNKLYGGVRAPHLEALEEAGAQLVYTDLTRLRDPNPAWSAIWRVCCQWFGNSRRGWLSNPVGEEPVTLRTYLALLNLKANHRKTLVVDDGDDWVGLVTSANPHDASSAHVNTGVVFRGPAALDLLATEKAVIEFSGYEPSFEMPDYEKVPEPASLRVQVLTESRIRNAARAVIDNASAGDQLDIAMFYFSHEKLIRAVMRAADRGVGIRVLLDPNRDAFGRHKNGVPNRQTGRRLHDAGIPVRWCHTAGEQCHIKQLLWTGRDGRAELLTGSANFTRRNLGDYNLETNVRFVGPAEEPLLRDARQMFEERWSNGPGWRVSRSYDAWEDRSRWRALQAWLGERLGWSSF